MTELIILLVIFLVVSFLYSSIGHGGASGYIAILTIFGISSAIIRPSALMLNVFVASISFYSYYKEGYFRWKLFYQFAIASVPMAYLGSFIALDSIWYKRIIGICLVFAVLHIAGIFNPNKEAAKKEPSLFLSLLIGAGLGLLSGIIGIGGGIILSPLILILGWANLKETAAVSALFIVVNSVAGIIGLTSQEIIWPPEMLLWLIIVIIGGTAGAYWGSRKAENLVLKYILTVVLLFASIKLIFI